MKNYEEHIKTMISISENITTIQNTIIDEYNNPISIDIFTSLFKDIIDKLVFTNNKLLFYNYDKINLNLNNIRININKIIFIIHYLFMFQYIKNKYDYNITNFDFFENKFNDMENFFSTDLILNESLIDKLKKYSLLKKDFSIEVININIEDIDIEFKICNGIKIINYLFFYTQTQIKKFVNSLKIICHDENFKKIQHYIKPSYNYIKPSCDSVKSSYDSCCKTSRQNKHNLKQKIHNLKNKCSLKVSIFKYIIEKYNKKRKKYNILLLLLILINMVLIVSFVKFVKKNFFN